MKLYDKLEYHYKAFDRSKLEPDPLQFLHKFSKPEDIEVIGLIASVFAYGNVKQINNTLNKIILIMGGSPYNFIINFRPSDAEKFHNLKHRFYTSEDITRLFEILKSTYQKFISLNNLFLFRYNPQDENIKSGISGFSKYFLESYQKKYGLISNGFSFMFPLPEKNSACKRMNLFLRWMVRKDELDFGIWGGIQTNKLLIPVDTHVARICKNLKLTKRKNASWQMAEEITNHLKNFDPDDPVKYDFAICHIGMRRLKF